MTEPDVSMLMTVAEATGILDSVAVSPRGVEVPLEEAQGMRLADDLPADRDYPPFDKSQMDGIACRHADTSGSIDVAGAILAGQWPAESVQAGTAVRIMTGAPIPPGADTVVPVEFLEGESTVRLTRAVKPGNAIARRASEVRAGQAVLTRGTALGPAQLAVAATVGASRVHVYARPRVAVLSTGDELVAIDAMPAAGQIRNSNSLMLSAMLYAMGAEVTDLGSCADEPDALREAITGGLADFDVLFLSGGVSMGTHDFVPGLLSELGVTLRIAKVKMKPGKPFVFGTHDRGFVFGLPGNPVSSFVCTTLFASRLMTRLAGGTPVAGLATKTLAEPLPANGPREFYQPAAVEGEKVVPLNWKGSSDLFTLARAGALIVRPENQPALAAGENASVLIV